MAGNEMEIFIALTKYNIRQRREEGNQVAWSEICIRFVYSIPYNDNRYDKRGSAILLVMIQDTRVRKTLSPVWPEISHHLRESHRSKQLAVLCKTKGNNDKNEIGYCLEKQFFPEVMLPVERMETILFFFFPWLKINH